MLQAHEIFEKQNMQRFSATQHDRDEKATSSVQDLPSEKMKIVLSTNIAETSLTIPMWCL